MHVSERTVRVLEGIAASTNQPDRGRGQCHDAAHSGAPDSRAGLAQAHDYVAIAARSNDIARGCTVNGREVAHAC